MKALKRTPIWGYCTVTLLAPLLVPLLALGLPDGTALAQGAPPAATAQTITPVAVDREALLRELQALAAQLAAAQQDLKAQPALAKKVKPRLDAAQQSLKSLERSLAGAPMIEGTSMVVTGGAAVGAVIVPPSGSRGPVVVVGSQSAGPGMGANVAVGGMGGAGMGANVAVTGVYTESSSSTTTGPASVMVVQASPTAGSPGTYQAPAPGGEVRRAVDSARLQEISTAISDESFGKGQLQVLQSAAASHYFTVDQLKGLLELFSFENEKLDAVAIVAPRLLDPENGYKLYGAFSFQSSKDKVAALLRR